MLKIFTIILGFFSKALGFQNQVKMGKPTKTNQIHMTLRPKYGDHQVQHTAQDT